MAIIKVSRSFGPNPLEIQIIPTETLRQKRARERNNVRTGNYEKVQL